MSEKGLTLVRAQRLTDQLCSRRANTLVRHVDRGNLADLTAADTRNDSAPALVAELVVLEVESAHANLCQ